MSSFETISMLCEATELLSEIVKKQQIAIEQFKIEEEVKADIRRQIKEADRQLDVIEFRVRKYCDTDDDS